MYCFHCGAPMLESADVLVCSRSGMILSEALRRELAGVFQDRNRPSRRPERGMMLRRPFYCPGCGLQMDAGGCPKCGEVLDEFAHAIVELHPHA